jgi:hypothetical protein
MIYLLFAILQDTTAVKIVLTEPVPIIDQSNTLEYVKLFIGVLSLIITGAVTIIVTKLTHHVNSRMTQMLKTQNELGEAIGQALGIKIGKAQEQADQKDRDDAK